MTDLQTILPGFSSGSGSGIINVLERNLISTTDLLVCDAVEIAKRTGLGVLDVRGFVGRVREALEGGLGWDEVPLAPTVEGKTMDGGDVGKGKKKLVKSGEDLVSEWKMISTLDARIDAALGGGFPVGYITEVTGESGAGKTQLLLSLLLTAQLPQPHGLSRPTLYISTESALPTTRLRQILDSNPLFHSLQNPNFKVSLDNIHSIVTPDLESQDHILRFQVPIFVARNNIGLIILDSVAANYRAEFERAGGGNMAKRSSELMRLGELFRGIAAGPIAGGEGCAVVVANQVADRFDGGGGGYGAGIKRKRGDWEGEGDRWRATQSSPLAGAYERRGGGNGLVLSGSVSTPPPAIGMAPPSSMIAAAELGLPHPGLSTPTPIRHQTQTPSKLNPHTISTPKRPSTLPQQLANRDLLSLDHQQRFFTGWGDDPPSSRDGEGDLKTPSLGLVWASQVACRVVLRKRAVYVEGGGEGEEEGNERVLKGWRRWLRVVFAPWVVGDGGGMGEGGVEYVIGREGVRSVDEANTNPG